jgi:hypothetical protein
VPAKMRRPSSPKTSVASSVSEQPRQKRIRVGKNLKVRIEDDSDGDMSISSKISVTSEDNMSITSTISEISKQRTRRNKATVEPGMSTTDTDQTYVEIKKTVKTRTRAQKKAATVTVPEVSDETDTPVKEVVVTRQYRNKLQATQEQDGPMPKAVESCADPETVKSCRLKSITESQKQTFSAEIILQGENISIPQNEKMEIEGMEMTTQVKETSTHVLVSKLLHVTLQRLPDDLSSTVTVTPSGTILNRSESVNNMTKVKAEDMEITMAAFKNKSPANHTNPKTQAPTNGLDLVAL